ncbi:MAG: winged helix-turn-helix domain-containing protein [Caldilineaceae bacterium]|nr:winged helix-turn-helix domain-containing protein [Caldilineaceae bacterium]MCB0139711.1 winged helix-turn-helix domain-containing protein [Caldilineaceae bacterium]MCB9157058.1 winged helix-turn-helix domain-containing protein [Caldilineaceae bacterium]
MATIGAANPFFHRTPVRDPDYFFGRQYELQNLCAVVRNGQSVAVIGPRRIGKSSLLWQIVHTLMTDIAPTLPYCAVYISGEAWQTQTSNALYAGLWQALLMTMRAYALAANLPPGDSETDELDFSTFMRNLRLVTSTGIQVVFLLDEFDALSRNRHLNEFFFSALRSLVAPLGIVYVTASTRPLLELTYAQQSALSSPFFNIFLPHHLELLSEQEAVGLLHGIAALGKLEMNAPQQQLLLDLAGPHPCFLQIAGYHYWEALQAGMAYSLEQLQTAIYAEAAPLWAYQWRHLTSDEQRALMLLATDTPLSPARLARLRLACLVQMTQGRAVPLSPLLASFVRQQAVYQILHVGPILIDQATERAWLQGDALSLTPQDYRLLLGLASTAGYPLSPAELATHLWPEDAASPNQDRLKTAVNSLRNKLGPAHRDLIQYYNGGYRLAQTHQ